MQVLVRKMYIAGKKMRKIFTYKRRADAISWYRHHGPLVELPNTRLINDTDFEFDHIDAADAVVINRGFGPHEIKLMLRAKKAGVRTVLDIDDAMFHLPEYNPTRWKPKLDQILDNHLAALNLADKVICSTVHLKKLTRNILIRFLETEAKRMGKSKKSIKDALKAAETKFHVIRNGFNDFQFSFAENGINCKRDKPMILWRGSDTHHEDVVSIASVIEDHDEQFRWYFMGWNAYILNCKFEWQTFEQDLYSYFKKLRELHPEFVIVPLRDNDFNRAKSNIAWLEASWVGAVTIAPNLPEWQLPGVLNYSNNAELAKVLLQARDMEIDERYLRVENSRRYIRENLLLSKLNERRELIIFGE